jgi:hypothetical protein
MVQERMTWCVVIAMNGSKKDDMVRRYCSEWFKKDVVRRYCSEWFK